MHPDMARASRRSIRRTHRPAGLALLVAGLVVAAAATPLAARQAGRAGSAAQAPSTTCLDAVQDGSVFEVQPDVSGGVSTTLKVSPAARLRTHAFMQFDLSDIPAEAIVVSATLRAYLESLQYQSVPVMTTEILAVADVWDEASLTWNNQPGGNTSFGTRNHDDTPGIKSWNAIGLVDHWRTVENYGVVVEGRVNPLVGNAFEATFTARESTAHPAPSVCLAWVLPTLTPTASVTPTLTLTPTATSLYSPTPEPTISNRSTPTSSPTDVVTATSTTTPTLPGSATATVAATPTATTAPGPTIDIVVTDPGDGDDADAADGRCADAGGECTLRAALQHAAALPSADAVTIRFARAMRIVVPHGRPLPPIQRDRLAVTGVGAAPPLSRALARLAGPLRLSAQSAPRPVVAIVGVVAGRPADEPGLSVAGDGVRIQGLEITGFAAGIQLAAGAQGALVGSDDDGNGDPAEANLLHGNRDGLRIDAGSTGHTIRMNALVANVRHGIATAQTAGGGNHITRNAIARNGRSAIAVDRGGAQVPPPVILQVDPRTGTVGGTGCPGCVVEIFTDNAEQAARYVDGGTVGVQADGTWSVGGLAMTDADGNVTATATRAERIGPSTSRLSAPVPRDGTSRWRLVEVPPSMPRALVGRRIRRTYRLVDAMGRPVPEAVLSFRPYDDVLRFESQPGGLVEVVIPTALALDLWRGQLHITLEAVEQRTGMRHAVDWLPRMGAALELPPGDPLLLDLRELSETGLGAIVRRGGGGAGANADALSGAAQDADAAMVGFVVAPPGSREGPYAWQENLAAGGGIYQVAPGDGALTGLLEIHAPVAAYDAAGLSSGCPGAPAGAVLAGWIQQDICWVPVPGASASAPAAGDETFAVSAVVDVPPAGDIGATTAYTLYTVGHDTTPPVILPQLAAGASVATLPAVLASAVDDASGVRATTGISVTLGGLQVPVTYDAASREIRVPAAARGLPAELPEGPAILAFAVDDGFCNRATRTVGVTITRSVLTPIYLPRAVRAR